MSLSVVILAAGNGKRMRTTQPKVLHKLAGRPILEHVVRAVQKLDANIFIVHGFGGDQVKAALAHLPVEWVLQEQRMGTGHAVLQALPHIPEDHQVLILVGDSPLISQETLEHLLAVTTPHGMGLVITHLEDPTGFGRVLHDQTGKVLSIIEERDASEDQKKITAINSGIIVAPAKKLRQWLPELRNDNAQGEYYLTDIFALAGAEDIHVASVAAQSSEEVLGINDRVQLAKLERHYQRSQAKQLMLNGTTLMDPERLDIRGDLTVMEDVTVDINVIFEGIVRIGRDSVIGPNCYIKNSVIGDDVEILANSVIEGAVIESNAKVGPFARLRPGAHLKVNARVGNFVEMKNTELGAGSKANHLSYLGDAVVGENVNIGAGTITCNYDGVNKHQTVIKDGAFIGSDTQLVAPVVVGKNATIGAGSTITRDAPDEQLTVSRSKQTAVPNWRRPVKKK